MSAFTWSPKWSHPQESFWSLANKIAFANTTTVSEVLGYLGGVLPEHRDVILFPEVHTAIAVASALQLDSGMAARSVFSALGALQRLAVREHWQLGIRYCPSCIDVCMHRTYFQDTRIERCQLHGLALLETCPYCGRPLDPLCRAAWCCNFCGFPLVVPGDDWAHKFEGEPSPSSHCTLAEGLLPATAVLAGGQGRSVHGPLVNRNRLADKVFEEHAACTHSLLGEHRGCLALESELGTMLERPAQYRCPVAAAAICAASHLGVSAQGVRGGWPNARAQVSGAFALNQLERLLAETLVSEHAATVQAAVRDWYCEALVAFRDAAAVGGFTALWQPGERTSRAGQSVMRDASSTASFEVKAAQLVASAGRFCTLKNRHAD